MKIGVIIPDRGDRPKFLENCLRMLKTQTIQPDIIELVDDIPLNDNCDITWRYRTGYDRLRNKDLDIIAFIENDDWYAPDYLETMINQWVNFGKPDVFGTNYTIYYHIKLFSYLTMNHDTRSSAMSTIIKPDLDFAWCPDHEPYTDMWLWNKLKGIVFHPEKHICLGVKHGVGLCGGRSHVDRLERYSNVGQTDFDKTFLSATLDKESFEFYSNYFNDEN